MARYDFAPHFSQEEFTCKCGCGTHNVNRGFLERLERARIRAERPFPVASGCRCEQHNEDEGGKDASSHLASDTEECYAVDIGVRGSRGRGIIIPSLVAVGFNRLGFAKSFVHADIDPAVPPTVIWLY